MLISVLALTMKSFLVILMSECLSEAIVLHPPKESEVQSLSCCTAVTTTPPKCKGHSWCLAGNNGTERKNRGYRSHGFPDPAGPGRITLGKGRRNIRIRDEKRKI